MKILISNDDGINSSGILAAKEAVEDLGDVTVVAPATQQSGIGRALTLFEPLRMDPVILNDESQGYSVSGTPTDAVTLGIFKLMDDIPDLAISGINIGENIGKGELTTSGTIGAAMEAASLGVPSIAVSLEVLRGDIKFENGHIELNYDFAKKILKKIAKNVLEEGLPKGVDLLNLNIPSNPESEEILVTKLGKRMYKPEIDTRTDPRGKPYYWIGGSPYTKDEKDTDIHGLRIQQRPTLTPLSIDLTTDLSSVINRYD
ncbi:5'-nucleotidase SurE [Methanobrevibacter cuticularis]|uniref:5'-nucleotidase SurE n=1 Tax=Methanobrevibacter cuticularis TaxID=47311 RepID=A0A166D2P2_9EURY|nr:5'/3'-nucleotidase SurE [Methanobrevibacter cuticularis]KZX15148.1 5'-nucleotidase SurE [Methanobrevibacter cuticularis]